MILHRASRSRGFSLIEILVAVVILATGLLALTALQGSLTKASAEAKVRGRVAAFVAGRMEALRNGPYGAIAAGSDSCASTTAPDWVPANVCSDAALGSFTATQTVTTWAGSTGFVEGATPADPDEAQFKRVTLVASWTDSTGRGHSLRSVSDISPLGFTSNLIVPPEAEGTGGGNPKVRQDNPVTAGMIPVALGDGSSSAASNPKPELKQDGQNQRIVATRFNVLNYIPEGDGSTVIQKRFENELVRCKCTKSADTSTSTSIYFKAQWPAIWTGDRYDMYEPEPSSDAPGQTVRSAPASGVTQSDLCTQCCRDHHDGPSGAKYDPERTVATGESTGREKYSRNGSGQYVIAGSGENYIDACRVIRVDGFWRVAADTYSRHLGLLPTTAVAGVDAKSGAIPDSVRDSYGAFVKTYAARYSGTTAGGSGDAPAGADGDFNAASLSLNATAIVVDPPNRTNDWRYLHARGLYIDHLEADARKRLADVLADTDTGGACPTDRPLYDCILPYLPFTTINMTELAKWLAENDDVLQVNSGNIMSNNPLEPFGGRTKGIAATTGAGDGTSADDENILSALKSNSGLAVYAAVRDGLGADGLPCGNEPGAAAGASCDGIPDALDREQFGVDPQDDTQVGEDRQVFRVIGNTNSGLPFYVRSVTSTSTTVSYSLGGGDSDGCTNMQADPDGGGAIRATDIKCVTQAASAPMAGSFTVANYWSEGLDDNVRFDIAANQCTVIGTGFTGLSGERVDDVPLFTNFRVNGVTFASGSASITSTMPLPADDPANDGKSTEATTVNFTGASANTIFNVSYEVQGTVRATIGTCTVTQGNGNNWDLTVNSWVKPWMQP